MKIWNLVGCVCCCPSWCAGCSIWLCTLSICGLSIQHLEKRHGLWLILVILCFWCTPFLWFAGIANWVCSIPTMIEKCKGFIDTGDAVQGFHDLIVPEQPGEGAIKMFNFVDSICKT